MVSNKWKGGLDNITDGIVNNVSNSVAYFFVKQEFNVAAENFEETISDIVGTIIARATKYSDFDSRAKIEKILKEIGYNGKYNRNTESLDSDISRYRNIITKNIRNNAIFTGGRTSTKNVKENSGNVRQQRASKSRNNNARVSQSIQIENNKSKNNAIKK